MNFHLRAFQCSAHDSRIRRRMAKNTPVALHAKDTSSVKDEKIVPLGYAVCHASPRARIVQWNSELTHLPRKRVRYLRMHKSPFVLL